MCGRSPPSCAKCLRCLKWSFGRVGWGGLLTSLRKQTPEVPPCSILPGGWQLGTSSGANLRQPPRRGLNGPGPWHGQRASLCVLRHAAGSVRHGRPSGLAGGRAVSSMCVMRIQLAFCGLAREKPRPPERVSVMKLSQWSSRLWLGRQFPGPVIGSGRLAPTPGGASSRRGARVGGSMPTGGVPEGVGMQTAHHAPVGSMRPRQWRA